ncbi:MAG: HAMP domain-containing sensor histidine kinase, partial [Patescibacteria group bacterium]
SFFGYLLIKSVLREVRQREEIQRLAVGLEDANKRLVKLDREKSEFLSIATHQLRTPMTVVKGYISMILEGTFGRFEEKAKEALAKVYTSNERLIKLIDDLLNISRIERGKMEYDFQELALEKLVGDVVSELKPVAERKNLKLVWQESKDLPKVKFDESKMRQVVLNLIDNAIKYTEKGEIVLKLERANQKIRLSVKDTGEGIEKEKLPLLFKRYSRLAGSKSIYARHTQGMGLGLYVAKRIIDDHKGKIWAESEGEGKGSTFFVELSVD